MNDKQARKLGTRIIKEGVPGLRVKFGKTNGHNVLHVSIPGSKWDARTIKSETEWNDCALKNENAQKSTISREVEVDQLTHLIANKDAQ